VVVPVVDALLEPLNMTTIFAVVGERCDDPLELLLLGADGQHYAYPLPDGPVTPVELDDQWTVDHAQPVVEEFLAYAARPRANRWPPGEGGRP
jgi:hypothetical protein